MLNIAVLMTSFNRVAKTLLCLDNLSNQIGIGKEYKLDVYLVDDASPDGTAAIIRNKFLNASENFHVRVIDGAGNLFWCKGMRLAWDTAVQYADKLKKTYDYFLWLNDDVNLLSDAIRNVIRDGEKANGVVVGTFALDETYSKVGYCAKRKDGVKNVPDMVNCVWIEEGYMNGNLVLVPRHIYEKIGAIYGGYSHGFGDYDYGMMLSRAGLGFWTSSHYCGWCECDEARIKDMRGASLRERLSLLTNPRGRPLRDTFIYRYRHWGIVRAVISSLHVIWLALFSKTAYR